MIARDVSSDVSKPKDGIDFSSYQTKCGNLHAHIMREKKRVSERVRERERKRERERTEEREEERERETR